MQDLHNLPLGIWQQFIRAANHAQHLLHNFTIMPVSCVNHILEQIFTIELLNVIKLILTGYTIVNVDIQPFINLLIGLMGSLLNFSL